jgi:hypothetical protein
MGHTLHILKNAGKSCQGLRGNEYKKCVGENLKRFKNYDIFAYFYDLKNSSK